MEEKLRFVCEYVRDEETMKGLCSRYGVPGRPRLGGAVESHGHFRWKKKKTFFLTEVLWGDSIGLLPIGHNQLNIYFANQPLVGFDPTRGKLVSLNNPAMGLLPS